MTQHLLGGADTPQEEPGDCTNRGDLRRRWWWMEGHCYGCDSWQRVEFTLAGWQLQEHTPAPPKYHADANGHPYPYPSYTQPDCDDCAAETDAASVDRGDSVQGYAW